MSGKPVLEEFLDAYDSAYRGYQWIRWALLGVVLIGTGVSQLITGWIGESFVMRFIYPIPLILFGAGVLYFCFVADRGTSDDADSKELRTRAERTLDQLLTGKYGPYELNDDLREELTYLQLKECVVFETPMHQWPGQGDELSALVAISPKLKSFRDDAAARG